MASCHIKFYSLDDEDAIPKDATPNGNVEDLHGGQGDMVASGG